MDDQNKNLILAIVLSGIVMLVWSAWFQPPPPAPIAQNTENAAQNTGQNTGATGVATPPAAPAPGNTTAAPVPPGSHQEKLKSAARIKVDTAELQGSITLLGGRIDDLALKSYRETLDKDSDLVTLLSPFGSDHPYYAIFGWGRAGDLEADQVPGPNTLWTLESGDELTEATPITLRWDNNIGMTFRRTISVDEHYMFSVAQSVENGSTGAHHLFPYGIVARYGEPDVTGFFILHEGVVRMSDGELEETKYSDMPDYDFLNTENANAELIEVEQNGWVGFTDKNWMTSLIPDPGQKFTSVAKYIKGGDIYTTEARLPVQTVQPGATVTVNTRLFAGAKEWETIRAYEQKSGILGFLDSIDWGWFFFLTKPIFWLLHTLNGYIGNMGWSIIALTIIIKAALLPLAYKSYVSMAKMKTLQPEMEALKERCGDDKQKMQKEMMALYKKEKVNPAAGCLPILLQIPIFFSLYKVIFVTLELRHAPFIGWLHDLSAPDPTSILNLFGLLPFAAPEPGSVIAIISLGVLPILLGISMWLQQKLNPTPTDPTQAMIMAWMPWVFMFMLGSFASGLVLYWITNNTITFIQQYAIMRSQGAKPDVFGNIRAGFARKKTKPKAKK
ncbi:MAG: membrane protein insertase YidC [Rhodobacterales bacterium]|nr:MAG: membrane protein insertase YidC [Rhodobacterales bacterium]